MAILRKVIRVLKKIFFGKKSPSSRKKKISYRTRRQTKTHKRKRVSLIFASKKRKTSPKRKKIAKRSASNGKKNRAASSGKNRRFRSAQLSFPNGSQVSPKPKKPLPVDKPQICLGEITHFFSKIQVGVVRMDRDQLRLGDQILIMGKDHQFSQKAESLQIESCDVSVARKNQLVGLKLAKPAKVGDKVYKVI